MQTLTTWNNSSDQPPTHVEINDFVIVEFLYDQTKEKQFKKTFTGRVTSKSNDSSFYKISFMRNYMGSRDVFIFPNVQDVDDCIPLERIKRVLKPVSEFRGRYIFVL